MTHCKICGSNEHIDVLTKNDYRLVRCTACGVIFVANPPSHEALQKMYSFSSRYHEEYEQGDVRNYHLFKHEYELARQQLKVVRKYCSAGSLLDIGCGAGFFLSLARQHNYVCTGLELSDDSARIGREKFKLSVYKDVQDIQGSRFDIITLFDVIEHVLDPNRLLTEAVSLLKPDGLLIISTPMHDGLFPKVTYWASKIIHHWPHPTPPYHLFQFSKKSMGLLLSRHPLKVQHILDRRIDIRTSFGKPATFIKKPLSVLYFLIFFPFSFFGPWLKKGDWSTYIIRKTSS